MAQGRRAKLVTIPFSHFNQRAKWALEHHGVTFDERPYMPMFHMFGVLRHTLGRKGRSDSISSPLSTPVLVLEGGEVLADSGEIVAWADEQGSAGDTLYPPDLRDEIEAFEIRLHDSLGGHTRRIAYSNGLVRAHMLRRSARKNVGAGQAALFSLMSPIVSVMLRKVLRVGPEPGRRSREQARVVIDELNSFLSGKAYCFGDRFTAADLTLSCMLAPLLVPQQNYGAKLPLMEELDPEVVDYVNSVRDTVAGRHALRMFEAHRVSPGTA